MKEAFKAVLNTYFISSDQIGASVGASVGAVAREIYAITSSDPSTPIAVSPELDLLKKDV